MECHQPSEEGQLPPFSMDSGFDLDLNSLADQSWNDGEDSWAYGDEDPRTQEDFQYQEEPDQCDARMNVPLPESPGNASTSPSQGLSSNPHALLGIGGPDLSTTLTQAMESTSPPLHRIDDPPAFRASYQDGNATNATQPLYNFSHTVFDYDSNQGTMHQGNAGPEWYREALANNPTESVTVGTSYQRMQPLPNAFSTATPYDGYFPRTQPMMTTVDPLAVVQQTPRATYNGGSNVAAVVGQQGPPFDYDNYGRPLHGMSTTLSSLTQSSGSYPIDTMTSETSFQPTRQDRLTLRPPLCGSTTDSVVGHDSSTLSVPGRPTSPALSITPSNVTDILECQRNGCNQKFTGIYRQGNRQRHHRLKHGLEERKYPCEESGCKKSYLRQDARVKHYRTHHSHLSPGPALSRKRSRNSV